MKNPFETGVPTRHLIYTIVTDVATSSTWRIVENKLWGMTLSKFRESESFSRSIGASIKLCVREHFYKRRKAWTS